MITEECINSGACEPECPNEAISEGEDIYVIDPNLCTECVGFHDYEACQALCPVECCVPDPNNRGSGELLLDRAKKIHPEQGIPLAAPGQPDPLPEPEPADVGRRVAPAPHLPRILAA